MTRKEEAADCRRKASVVERAILVGAVPMGSTALMLNVKLSYLALAEALEMECQVRDVVVGRRQRAIDTTPRNPHMHADGTSRLDYPA